MKYTWLLLLAGFSVLSACGSSDKDDENSLVNNFHIEGKITGAPNTTVKIEAQTDQGAVNVAETTTDGSGNYEIDGNIPSMGIYSLVVGKSETGTIVIPIDVNDHAVINGDIKSFSAQAQVSGTKWAKPYVAYQHMLLEFSQKYMATVDESYSEKEIKQAENKITDYVIQQVKKDPSNPVNIVLAARLFPTEDEGFGGYDMAKMEVLNIMNTAFQAKYPTSPITGSLNSMIGSIEQQYEKYQASTSGNVTAPEISLPDLNGKQHRLSDLKGKVVLIDFWASWCGPCRKENPNVVRLYKKYNSKGFEIFSVSLDTDKAAWKQAIQSDGLVWKNHVSDLMGWQTPLVQQYGINGIPYTVLIDGEGKIIGIGLRGAQLEQKLEEVLGKK
jgi:thiol-disulfide isomerase/thioredoxin